MGTHGMRNWLGKSAHPKDADWILNLKLPSEKCDDFFAWHYERSGIFSVKSAYRLAYNLNHGIRWNAGGSTRPDNSRNLWKPIWSANVPGKVKIFGWRAACDNLATKKNKFRRTLETDSTCSLCGMAEENSHHAIVDCSEPRALRSALRRHWDLPRESSFAYSGPDWLQLLLANCNKNQRDKILLLLWRSWHLRCDITHGKGEETISSSVSFLVNYWDMLKNGTAKNEMNKSALNANDSAHVDVYRSSLKAPTRWQPPPSGATKINVDAAFCQDTGEAVVGVVARDHLEVIVMAASKVINVCKEVEEAEACAIREGLKLAVEHDLEPMALESDCATAVKAVNSRVECSSRCWTIYRDIVYFHSLFPSCKILKIGRNSNSVAHYLAALTCRSSTDRMWASTIPDEIQELAVKDLVLQNSDQ
jgi:ribonuclease HI